MIFGPCLTKIIPSIDHTFFEPSLFQAKSSKCLRFLVKYSDTDIPVFASFDFAMNTVFAASRLQNTTQTGDTLELLETGLNGFWNQRMLKGCANLQYPVVPFFPQ